jgi:hypothetical protein
MIVNARKEYEKPESGQYVGVVADVVDLGLVQGKFGLQPKLRIVWLLWGGNGQGGLVPAIDSEGRQHQVMRQMRSDKMDPKSNAKVHLYETAQSILNGATPTVPFETETLIGRANTLFVQKEPGADGSVFANVKAIIPLPAGIVPPTIPATFVRQKDKQNQQAVSNQQRFVPTVPAIPAPVVSLNVPAHVPAVQISTPVIQQPPVIDLNAGAPQLQTVAARPQF